ncbi:N-acetylmuramic acid 6-phosphate etherase [Kiloniella laminariae]|uniref:N-acetylmuramic acid 6-phosphate etherase n=1 Tax=Kiloniella laminariae TaxID=454162 RepID=A0ABT4LLV8_9PROT|nr:N-acetylmuramic acid 6-phosphate etherase [Kiloniella laminariae]MCZ4282110.1 N-acetylmuramic acid 6-phosphate etherase [Kiloniella laminariae]
MESDTLSNSEKHTEQKSSRYRGLDSWSDTEVLESLWASQAKALASVQSAIPFLEQAALEIVARLKQSGRLFYIGAGASGHLAIQDGLELHPTYGWPLEKTVLMVAGGAEALLYSMGGVEDDRSLPVKELKEKNLSSGDVVIAVAASGSTPYTLAAVEYAQSIGALVVSIANNPEAPLFRFSNYKVFLGTGAEVVAGSTRMAAGTAQKIALNMLSTLVMTKLGHVHDGLMVSMTISNEKLIKRAVSMVQEITGVTAFMATQALSEAENNIKLACLIALGHSKQKAEQVLGQNGWILRQAIETLETLKK